MSSEPSISWVERPSPRLGGDPPELPAAEAASNRSRPPSGASIRLQGDIHSSSVDDSDADSQYWWHEESYEPESQYPRLSDPYTHKPETPDGDPYVQVFKLLKGKDTVQCKAWEDEVQNILLFAALFSAVVTAFIIESYQRLQPDPNDVMISLLAHIAERIDGTPDNATISSVSSILSQTGDNFVPAQSAVRINIAWFISLVLSLTAALTGIVTLQWLREHQRYPSRISKEHVGILHLRRQSLKQWYVPQIFASLPLLIQGSLVFFFAGIIDFLFGLRTEVAIPVTLCICIPFIFLLATTILPLMQIYILQLPLGLPAHTIPSPCAYKSPQSTIIRRIGTAIYNWIQTTIKMIANKIEYLRYGPHQWQEQDFVVQDEIDGRRRPGIVSKLLSTSGGWASLDNVWLEIRGCYSTFLGLPSTTDFRGVSEVSGLDYDTLAGFGRIMELNPSEGDTVALYQCVDGVYSQRIDNFQRWTWNINFGRSMQEWVELNQILHRNTGLDPFGDHSFPKSFIEDVLANRFDEKSNKEFVRAVLLSSCLSKVARGSKQKVLPFWHELISRMILVRLQVSPERLFTMESADTWLPDWMLRLSRHSESLRIDKMPILVIHATSILHSFLEKCSQPDRLSAKGSRSRSDDSSSRHNAVKIRSDARGAGYGAVREFLDTVVDYQSMEERKQTLVRLRSLCETASLQEQPLLFLTACFYIDTVFFMRKRLKPAFGDILDFLLSRCNLTNDKEQYNRWEGLDEAVLNIYNEYMNTSDAHEMPQQEPEDNHWTTDTHTGMGFHSGGMSAV